MALFWIVREIDGERRVMIREDHAMIFASIRAAMDGFGGSFVEAHRLDAEMAKRIPKAMTRRTLTMDEAAALLDQLA
jgi:hypothetical protein